MSTPASQAPLPARRGRRGQPAYRGAIRGFTLPELLAVVGMIAVLAAISAPMAIGVMRDRRVNRSANAIAEMYRLARSRALGRGAAVLVRWDAGGGSGSNGLLEMREAIASDTNPVPTSSCLIDWADTTKERLITSFETSTGLHDLAEVAMFDEASAAQAFGEICFSPRGRTFVRYDAAGAFVPLSGVPSFQITNKSQSAPTPRYVFVPPNGVARVQL